MTGGGGDEGIDNRTLFAFQGLGKGGRGPTSKTGVTSVSQSVDLDIDGRIASVVSINIQKCPVLRYGKFNDCLFV